MVLILISSGLKKVLKSLKFYFKKCARTLLTWLIVL